MKLNFILSASLIVALSAFLLSCDFFSKKSARMKMGEEVIAKVEAFKKDKGRLPESSKEMGIVETEAGPVFYQKKSHSRYIVSFSIGFDETYSYDSDTKEWQFGAIL